MASNLFRCGNCRRVFRGEAGKPVPDPFICEDCEARVAKVAKANATHVEPPKARSTKGRS